MSYEQLISEHARIDARIEHLLGLLDAPEPDVSGVVLALSALSLEVTEHLAHEDSFIYPKMIAATSTEMSEAALSFVGEFATLRLDWSLYLSEWSGEAVAADWDNFRAETRTILNRLTARVSAENELLYPAAFREGVISLRSRG